MKMLFIPSWNGHLYLQEKDDVSVKKIFEKIDFKNKEMLNVSKNNFELTHNLIEKKFDENSDEFVLSVTGDHSNTYSLFKSFAKKHKNPKLIIFDAHPDVEMDTGTVSHEDYLRMLIEENIVNPRDVYLFGIRTFSRLEMEYLIEKKVNIFTISDILRDKEKIKKILSKIKGDVYLSLDVDVLDSDDAPGTYYTEWCGLYVDELISYVQLLKENILAADICEYYALKDKKDVTLNNVLKIIDNFK